MRISLPSNSRASRKSWAWSIRPLKVSNPGYSGTFGTLKWPVATTTWSLHCGPQRAIQLVEVVCKAQKKALDAAPIFQSDFLNFSIKDKAELVLELEKENVLDELRGALSDFLYCYPEAPISFLFDERPDSIVDKLFLKKYKKYLAKLYDKMGVESIQMQALGVYILLLSGWLNVYQGHPFGYFEEIGSYPETEKSQEVASAIRTTIISQVGVVLRSDRVPKWSDYFWRRGLELEPIEYSAYNG